MISDIPTLKAFADHALEFAITRMREYGGFHPTFQVMSESGIDVLSAEGEPEGVPQHVFAEALCNKVRDLVKERNAYAVCNVGECWIAEISETHPLASFAKSGKYNTAQLENMGVVKRREGLVVSLETPIYQRVILQFFYRNGHGNVILREKKDRDSAHPGFQPGFGRFFNFFEKETTAHA